MLARAASGMQTWKFDAAHNRWSTVVSRNPALSDDSGWDQVQYYSTIQTAVLNNELYMFARAASGMQTWKFDAAHNRWSTVVSRSPALSDDSGWNKVQYYSTIQTAVVNNQLYMLARAASGMQTWKFDATHNRWSTVVSRSPAWSDDSGWDKVQYYSTIQSTVVNNELYLLARSAIGMQTWKFDAINNSWSPNSKDAPITWTQVYSKRLTDNRDLIAEESSVTIS